jgi:hypothetical protein
LDERNALKYGGFEDRMQNSFELKNIKCHETIEYIIMLRSAINIIEYRYLMNKAKKEWEKHLLEQMKL